MNGSDRRSSERRIRWSAAPAGVAPRPVGDDEAPILDDRDAGRDPLHFVEFVGGEEDGSSRSSPVSRSSRSNSSCIRGSSPDVGSSRMTSSGRCIDGEQDADLLPIALGEGASRPLEVDLEPLDKLVEVGSVLHPAGLCSEVDVLLAGQARVERELAGEVSDASMDRHGVGHGVDPEDLCCTRVGWESPVRRRIVVVLPAPFGPRNPKISPSATMNSRPSTPRSFPNVLVRFSALTTTVMKRLLSPTPVSPPKTASCGYPLDLNRRGSGTRPRCRDGSAIQGWSNHLGP